MDTKPRIAVVVTHPIQYYAPLYRALAQEVDLRVYFCHQQSPTGQGKAGFGVAFQWDVPLLDGYPHEFLGNRSRRPDVSSFAGCDTPELGTIIRQGGFDAVIVHGWAVKSYWQAILSCWASRTPVLVRGDSHLRISMPRVRRVLKYPLYRAFISRFDGYLCVGKLAREYYLHYGGRPERMFFSPHAVDNEFFAARAQVEQKDRGRLRRDWGIPEDACVFLFSGKFVPRKRGMDLVRAIEELARQGLNVWGLMVGDGPERRALEAYVVQRSLPIRFTGFLNQTWMPRAFAVSDALVVPSSNETWGLVVNEAMACGLPAVVSDQVGCGPDLIEDGVTGFTYPIGDVPALVEHLRRLAEQPGLRAALAQQATSRIQDYSIDRAVAGVLQAVATLRPENRER